MKCHDISLLTEALEAFFGRRGNGPGHLKVVDVAYCAQMKQQHVVASVGE